MISHLEINGETDFAASGCFLICDDEVLLVQRQSNKSYPKHWGVPTGKLEVGEEPKQCMLREIHEELSIKLQLDDLHFVSKNSVSVDGFEFLFYSFVCFQTNKPNLKIKEDELISSQWVPVSAVRKRRVVPYLFNTLNDALEWRSAHSLQLRMLPEDETRRVKNRRR